MPRANAARQFDPEFEDEMASYGTVPPSEQSRYEPRFRVVTRKPLVSSRRRHTGFPLQRSLVLVAIPAVCLVLYVVFWTMAMRGGYLQGQLEKQIQEARVERASLEAERQELRSSGMILEKARKMGMEPAHRREFAQVPGRGSKQQ